MGLAAFAALMVRWGRLARRVGTPRRRPLTGSRGGSRPRNVNWRPRSETCAYSSRGSHSYKLSSIFFVPRRVVVRPGSEAIGDYRPINGATTRKNVFGSSGFVR